MPELTELPAPAASLPRIDAIVGLDAESETVHLLTVRDDLLALDLVTGRIDTIARGVIVATLGPDGTVYAVDRERRVTAAKRRARRTWPDTLPGAPQTLFGSGDQQLLAVMRGAEPRLVRARADRPPAPHPLPGRGDVAATFWGELLAVASDSGVTLLDASGRRDPYFVRLRGQPRALAFSPSGHRLYVARRATEGLAEVDPFARREIEGVALPSRAAILRLDPSGRWLLAGPSVADTAWIVDLPTRTVRGAVATPWRADLPALSPDGTLLVRRGDDVVALSPDSQVERGRVAGGATDLWLASAWRPRGARDAVADAASADTAAVEGPHYVQVSVSQNRDWSTENAQQLSRAGLPAQVLPPRSAEDGYRVVLGPYPSREAAEAIGRKLGRPFWIYQPGGSR